MVDYKEDFFQKIKSVNWGGTLWLALSTGAGRIDVNFPGQSGGTPGFVGLTGPADAAYSVNHHETTAAGASVIGFVIGGAFLLRIGGFLASGTSFPVSCILPKGGAINLSLLDGKKFTVGESVGRIILNAPKHSLATLTKHNDQPPANLQFTVNPVAKTIS